MLVGLFARWLLPRLALPASGLYPVAVIALLMLAYGLAVVLHTSGFAAVYVVALILAASPLPHRRSVLGFIEGLAWTVQIGLFVMLGLLAFPSRLGGVGRDRAPGGGAAPGGRPPAERRWRRWVPFLRPGWVTRRTRTEPMPWQWVAFVSWAGLRGAVPIIFATIPLGSDVPDGELIFDVTLLLVIMLTLLQAPTMPMLGRRLGLVRTERVGELTVEAAPLDTMHAALLDLDIPAGLAGGRHLHQRAAAAHGGGGLARGPQRPHARARPHHPGQGRRPAADRQHAAGAGGHGAGAAVGLPQRSAGRLGGQRDRRRARLTRRASARPTQARPTRLATISADIPTSGQPAAGVRRPADEEQAGHG